jgi:hypothetical protein
MVVIAWPQGGTSRHHFHDTAMAAKKAGAKNSSAANRRMITMMHLNCWTISCVEGELLMGDTLVRHGRPPFSGKPNRRLRLGSMRMSWRLRRDRRGLAGPDQRRPEACAQAQRQEDDFTFFLAVLRQWNWKG